MRKRYPHHQRASNHCAILVAGLLLAQFAHGQDATMEGALVKVPAVLVNDTAYRIELLLDPESEHTTFTLSHAEELNFYPTLNASTYEEGILSIPSIALGNEVYWLDLRVSNENPIQFQPMDFGTKERTSTEQAFHLFEQSLSGQVINSRCVVCHIDGGIASTSAITYRTQGEHLDAENFDRLVKFVLSREDGMEYILNKATGGANHGGGIQLAISGADYNNFTNVLALLTDSDSQIDNSADGFFDNVTLQSNEQTLRRAAIHLAGRAPTEAEINTVNQGDEAELRSTIRELMQGENFHEFLKDGANDQLLTRGIIKGPLTFCQVCFPEYQNQEYEMNQSRYEGEIGNFEFHLWWQPIEWGIKEAGLELIAHIVQEEKPYTEILTADYMMMNSALNSATQGSAIFDDGELQTTFKPSQINEMYYRNPNQKTTFSENTGDYRVDDPGVSPISYPHAGILTDMAFLVRYPTTPTNRNRARSRWTQLHFLGFDVERSTSRTTDQAALTDPNNPTLNNPNCTVCHAALDPVAGAFQNWFEVGLYRPKNGMDALDDDYKYPKDGSSSPYVDGDTWYADMLPPGFNGVSPPDPDRSLQWLAQQIVNDTRFAIATVKFWWPVVIGSELILEPEVTTDFNYEAHLLAYNEQQKTIASLADEFAAGDFNLKDLLVNLVMSNWFRAEQVTDASRDLINAHAIAGLGNETLLTPEKLQRKTEALTGYTFDNYPNWALEKYDGGLETDYGVYYGGIDSSGVTTRSRELTPLMMSFAMTHALDTSCPITMREFALPDGSRKLLNGISPQLSPLTAGVLDLSLKTSTNPNIATYQFQVELKPGEHNLQVTSIDSVCGWNESTQSCASDNYLQFQEFAVRSQNGALIAGGTPDRSNTADNHCASYKGDDGIHLRNCSAEVPLTISTGGTYEVSVNLSAHREGISAVYTDDLKASLSVLSAEDPYTSDAWGAQVLKEKISELFFTLHGEQLSSSHSKVEAVYNLFIDTWLNAQNANHDHLDWNSTLSCPITDDTFLTGLNPPIEPYEVEYQLGQWPQQRKVDEIEYWEGKLGYDPDQLKQGWVAVLVYMLASYNYLFE